MSIVGLITEYNPFHNGHMHHLRQSKHVSGADVAVAIMGGHFLQRGEPALVDKWVRTEMALAAGVDLVFELPFVFACNSAPHFATGAVGCLNALGVVDALCFGSESGDLAALDKIATVLLEHARDIETRTSACLRAGMNYPVARVQVLAQQFPGLSTEVLDSPNNILGIEYLKALHASRSSIQPLTIERTGVGYHDSHVVANIASATGIRAMLDSGEDVRSLVPEAAWPVLDKSLQAGLVLDHEKLWLVLQAHLLQETARLEGLYMVENGIERRLQVVALEATSFSDCVTAVKSKHWTRTRVQRVLMHILMQSQAKLMRPLLDAGPLYLRLLGCTPKGRTLLGRIRKRTRLPIIADPAKATNILRRFYRHHSTEQQLAYRMLQIEVRATAIYSLLQRQRRALSLNQDYYQPVRRV